MHIFEILYSLSTTVALLACLPQARQLIVTKCSDELSLTTWTMWLGTQCFSLGYALSIGQTVLVAANCGWIVFYVGMLALILHYRMHPKPREQQPVEATIEQ